MLFAATVLFLLPAPAPAAQQPGERPDWVMPEAPASNENDANGTADWVPLQPRVFEPSHQRRVELHSLRYGVRSADINQKLGAVQRIEELRRRGDIEPWDREIMAVLHYAATEGVSHRITEGGRPPASFLQVRLRAVEVLGHVGGPFARATVLEVIRYDYEPLVLGEATIALARMRAEADEELIIHLTHLIERMRRIKHDERLAWSVLVAVEELDRQSWGMQHPALFRAILGLAQAPYSTRVQRKVIEVIDLLRRAP